MQYRAHAAQGPSPFSGFDTATAPRTGKYASDHEAGWRPFLILTTITFTTCLVTYFALSPFFAASSSFSHSSALLDLPQETHVSQCCRGTQHYELWGHVVRSGNAHMVNSSHHCCNACKAMCSDDGPCLCNSWVFCADPKKCGNKFGECWLKMQEDPLNPDVHDSSHDSMWTSGLIYGKDVGIIGFETEHGTIRIKLLPECAPVSVGYVLELLKNRRCSGIHYYRAESRGSIWDALGNRVNKSATGPPYALVQGTLEAQCSPFKEIEKEACPNIRRGTVGWIGEGPDFFISLANHDEWYPKYTVFAQVLPADLHLVEKLVLLPTTASVWEGVSVSVLNQSVKIRLKRA